MLVALMAQKAEVKFDPAYVMAGQIATRITELGYPATLLENETTGQISVELSVMFVVFSQSKTVRSANSRITCAHS